MYCTWGDEGIGFRTPPTTRRSCKSPALFPATKPTTPPVTEVRRTDSMGSLPLFRLMTGSTMLSINASTVWSSPKIAAAHACRKDNSACQRWMRNSRSMKSHYTVKAARASPDARARRGEQNPTSRTSKGQYKYLLQSPCGAISLRSSNCFPMATLASSCSILLVCSLCCS